MLIRNMESQKVIVSILSWNPDVQTIRRSLSIFKNHADHVVITDNGSELEVRSELKKIESEFKDFVTFIWNEKNLGNASGLNCGVQEAIREGAYWIMPIDDDSVPTDAMIPTMLEAYRRLSASEQALVGRIGPNYTTAKGLAFPSSEPYITDGAISSGELIKADVYAKIGSYQDNLFVDLVDSEFSHRAFRNNIKALIVPAAILNHHAGDPVLKKFLWITAAVPNYPPSRYYYISRNAAYLYIRNFGEYTLKGANKLSKIWLFLIPRYLIKAVLFEDKKVEKIGMVLRGTVDGLRGKLGKLNNNDNQRVSSQS